MKQHMSLTYRIFTVCNYIFMLILSASMILPIFHIAAKSFSSKYAIVDGLVYFWPLEFHVDNYVSIIASGTLPRAFMVTAFITVVGTILNLLFTVMFAYPLSKRDLRGRAFIMFLVVFTMIFGAPMIPRYIMIKNLGLIDSYWALIVPGLIGAFNMILVRTFFLELPGEIFDSAHIDGCSEWRTLWQIALPLSIPVFVTVGLFYAVGHWNTFQDAIIYINKPKMYPLQVVLRELITEDNKSSVSMDQSSRQTMGEGLKAAAIILSTVPILCVYPFLQKYFMKGTLIGSIK